MPKINKDRPSQPHGSYDPNGPFTGNPHDDRPEVVTPADLERQQGEVTEDSQVTSDTEVTGQDGATEQADTDVPTSAVEVVAWACDDRLAATERARRIGRAMSVERARRGGPRATVMRELEAAQQELSRQGTRGSSHDN
jgi:hypothetical protein